jgi:hypothetical protein
MVDAKRFRPSGVSWNQEGAFFTVKTGAALRVSDFVLQVQVYGQKRVGWTIAAFVPNKHLFGRRSRE